MRDLVVAGGGPVGLATALYAARAGLDVVVHEPREGVIDKACGEGLMPGAVARLDALDVAVPGWPIAGIRYLAGRRRVEAPFGSGEGRGVRRTVLHAALRDAVHDAGVATVPSRVREVLDLGDRVVVDGLPARHLIAADGLHSPVRRMLGLAERPRGPRRYGLRCHVEVAPWADYVEVHWAPVGEAYVTPVGPGLVGVAVLSATPRPWEELIAHFPLLLEKIAGRPTSRARGAGPLRQRVTRCVSGRVLLVGDAAGYVDALTGEGIALGLAQAEAAVAAVAADDPEQYARGRRRLVARHELLTLALVSATRLPLVRRHVVTAAAVAPGVFRAAVDQLARPA